MHEEHPDRLVDDPERFATGAVLKRGTLAQVLLLIEAHGGWMRPDFDGYQGPIEGAPWLWLTTDQVEIAALLLTDDSRPIEQIIDEPGGEAA